MAFELKLKNRRTKQREILQRDNVVLEKTMAGWKTAEIGKHLNYAVHGGQCQRVIQIQNALVEKGRLTKNENGTLEIAVRQITEHKWQQMEKSMAEQNVKEFQTSLAYMKQNNKSPRGIRDCMGSMTVLFNTLNMHPNEIVTSVDETGKPNYIQVAREALLAFKEMMDKHQVVYNLNTRGKGNEARGDTGILSYRNAMRQLLASHNLHIPKLPKTDILSGTKGEQAGAYNAIGLTDKQLVDCIKFAETHGKDILNSKWDYGYVCALALMPEIISRSEPIATWKISYTTEYDEYERMPVEYDFIQGFFEPKTKKSRPQGWDKFIIDPFVRKILHQLNETRKGKTLIPFNDSLEYTSQRITKNLGKLVKAYYVDAGILPEDCLKKVHERPDSANFQKGSRQYFYDTMGLYVLRHTGAHKWCRRTKYDYGFVAGMGWTDINTLADFYAGMDLKQRLKENDCFYCNPPTQPDKMANESFCSATHAFIYFSNGMKAKSRVSQ